MLLVPAMLILAGPLLDNKILVVPLTMLAGVVLPYNSVKLVLVFVKERRIESPCPSFGDVPTLIIC